jgi:glycosyltransferase involved in cell wall biosynthesis
MPRVTVFVPTYNRADLLPASIESVLGQTYRDLALVVSDNASTDATADVVARFDDPRLEYVRQPENVGLLGNYDWCLRNVETELALILADDDLAYPELLERAVRVLDERPRVGAVHTAFDLIGPDGGVLLHDVNWTYGLTGDTIESPEQFVAEAMRWSCRVCASTTVFRREALPAGGMVADEFPAIDFGLWLRIAAGGWDFAFLGTPLGAYRIHGATETAALGVTAGASYVKGSDVPAQLKEVKLGFLEEIGDRLGDPRRLRRLAERAQRRELLVTARGATLPERRRGATYRALREAITADHRVLLELGAWRLAAGSLLGPRVVDRLTGEAPDGRPRP